MFVKCVQRARMSWRSILGDLMRRPVHELGRGSRTLLVAIAVAALAALAWQYLPRDDSDAASAISGQLRPLTYPVTRVSPQTDSYFGESVSDPYRWLEAEARESTQVADWVAAQNAVTFEYLDTLEDRYRIKDRLTGLWNYEKFTLPFREGGRYFFRRNDGLQNQFTLHVQNALDEPAELLLDPNSWSVDGATALASYVPSRDGSLVLYAIQDGGSDWRTLKVLDTATKKTLDDTIEWVKFSGLAWAPDGSGFYYSRYPTPEKSAIFQAVNYDHALYFHEVGTPQDRDKLIYARADDPTILVRGYVAADRFLVVTMSRGTDARYEIAIQDLAGEDSAPEIIIAGFENEFGFFAAQERILYAVTDRGAPHKRIVAIDLDAPAEANWREVVAESNHLLVDASLVGGVLIAEYLEEVKSVVRRFELTGKELSPIKLPGIGSAFGFEGEPDDSETFYTFSSYNEPTAIYRYDTRTDTSEILRRPATSFDPSAYVVKQVFFRSADGTTVPMFVSHRIDLDRTQPVPTLLYGYGGFNISLRPGFSLTAFAWMEMGGVYAVANLRGGGEYGKAWHEAGRLLNKQNVFDDFIAAAEHLVAEGYTTTEQLGIFGGSNGGLLVGAVTNQRPDLFAVALPAVGVMDMLRFDQFTAGRFWRDDYGSPSENEADFRNNYAFSPYHNIRDGVDYPAVLITTADTDDRVVPGHSFKYAAALHAADTGSKPKLIRIETRAGHGSGKPTDKIIEEVADRLGFLAEHTGLKLPEGYGN